MGYCPFCRYGWPKPIAEIYDRYLPLAGDSAMLYGPAHIVWADENFEREHVAWCLEHFEEYTRDHAPDALAAVRQSLVDLLALPDTILDPFAEFDWDDPDSWQKPTHIEFVHR